MKSKHRWSTAGLSVAFVIVLVACAEERQSPSTDYYPISLDDLWVYWNSEGMWEEFSRSVVGVETLDLGYGKGEREVFVVERTYSVYSEERDVYYIEDDGTRVVLHRVEHWDQYGSQTRLEDYLPGSLVFDRGRVSVGDEWTGEYTHREEQPYGGDVSELEYEEWFKILAVDQEVVVPAGTFECLVVQRTIAFYFMPAPAYLVEYYYFAPGVGLVKTDDDHIWDLNQLKFYSVGEH